MIDLFIERMTVLGRGLVFQPVLVTHTCTYVTRSHKMVLKSILVATEILIYSERGENADYYGEKINVVSVKIKKLWRVKVSGSESSHFEEKQFKVVQHILGIFP